MSETAGARRGAFTLVELLIVIIIIAILAGMMMMTTGSATDRAQATKIINDLRTVKSAAMMYYMDYRVWPKTGSDVQWTKSYEKYLDRSIDSGYLHGTQAGLIGFAKATGDTNTISEARYIGFNIKASGKFSKGVMDKLEQSAKDAGLYGGPDNGYTNGPCKSGTTWIFMSLK